MKRLAKHSASRSGETSLVIRLLLLIDAARRRVHLLIAVGFLVVLRVFLGYLWCGEIRQWIAPDVMAEPGKIMLHHGALGFWFGDGMAETFVYDHRDGDATVL